MIRIDEIRKLKFFEGLRDEELASIAARINEKQVAKNSNILLEGSRCRELYLIKKGRVKVFKTSREGREHIYYYAHQGEAFCEAGIFDGKPSDLSATAVTDSLIYVIRKPDLLGLVSKIPQLSAILLRNYSSRIRQLISMVEGLSFKSVPGRLARILVDMVNREGVVQGDNIILQRNITLYEMASLVGTVREVVTRSLQELEKKGYLNVHRRQIEILDLEALKSL